MRFGNLKKFHGGIGSKMNEKLIKTFEGKTVLITGHTGFKGSWLSIWLKELGANVIGYSLDPPTTPNNFELTNLKNRIISIKGDIRDKEKLAEVIFSYKPEIIIHLAAQTIVLKSYEDPRETFDTNVMGTLNILESARNFTFIKTILVITSDKCYKDQKTFWGYRENEHLGGKDPYSASKGMTEILVNSYRESFFSEGLDVALASARAGNVIGGGDFADFRLVPDSMRSLISKEEIKVRNPESVRPWQHVLVTLSGYLNLIIKLQEERKSFADAWNFGPIENKGIKAREVADKIIYHWGSGKWLDVSDPKAKKETDVLRLNWDKVYYNMGWTPSYNWEEAIKATVEWFKEYEVQKNNSNPDLYNLCSNQIKDYTEKASSQNLEWAN